MIALECAVALHDADLQASDVAFPDEKFDVLEPADASCRVEAAFGSEAAAASRTDHAVEENTTSAAAPAVEMAMFVDKKPHYIVMDADELAAADG